MPLLWLASAFLAGILAGAAMDLPVLIWGCAAGIAFLFIFIEIRWLRPTDYWNPLRRWLPLPLGLMLAGFFLGGLRWQSAVPSWGPTDLAYYNGNVKGELTGWISDYPDRREGAVLLRVKIETIQPQGSAAIPVTGDSLLRLPPGNNWQYGDRLVIWGVPADPPDEADFSYKDYLARQGIYTYLMYPGVRLIGSGAGSSWMARIFQLREYAYSTINRIFPQPEAALLSGVLLGLDHDLPESIEKAFQDTGTAHIVAISGFNMSVLAALLISLFGRFLPRGWTALTAAVTIAFYTVLVGGNPAVVRAAIMSSLALFGRLIGRGSSGVTPLALSAATMCAVNPLLPWDAGFQLSFSATLGLMIYGEPLQNSFESWVTRRWGDAIAKRLAGPVGEYFLFTLAAQVTTLPVVLYHFNRLSLSAILANPLILPAQPGVMILGGVALIAGMLMPTLGQALAWLAWPLAAYTLRVVELLARIPSGAISVGDFTSWMVVVSYALLFGATFGWRKLESLRDKIRPGLVFASLGLVTLVAWSAVLRLPDGRLHVTLLDQVDGQAVVVTTAGGQRVLVGGAAGANQLGSDLGRLSGPLDRNLDALVIHSASANTLEGLPLLIERFPLEKAFWAVAPPDKRVAGNINQALADRSTPVSQMEVGSRLQLDEGVILHVLAVDEEYAALQLEYGNLCLIWPGRFSPDQLGWFDQRVEGCLLLVDESVDLKAWNDQRPVQFIFFGAAPLSMPGALATDSHGQIELVSDGVGLWVNAEKVPKKD
ncbi:MAG TPA: ComEC/Rec2 family competence protein [Bellilinea sp.]|nr:ComEC/Rec2 family competence protein [Bellilinea sp.]